MKKSHIIPLFLAAVLAAASFTGCGDTRNNNGTGSSSVVVSPKLDGIAETEIKANIAEEATGNDTVFKLNKVVDSGMTDGEGKRFIYLDAVIKNNTDKEYSLSILNNMFVLFSDGEEAHYDVRTQLYGVKNIEGYVESPFQISANGEISGIFGGFLVPENVNSFTVCFFPTQDVLADKTNVIKVEVGENDFVKLTPPESK